MVEESVDSCKHGANYEELQDEEREQVGEEDHDPKLAKASMLCPITANHIHEVAKDLASSKHGTIHPAPPLLHEDHH